MVDDIHSKDIQINKLWKLTTDSIEGTLRYNAKPVGRTFRTLKTLQERRKRERWAAGSPVRMCVQQLNTEDFFFSDGQGIVVGVEAKIRGDSNLVQVSSLWMEHMSNNLLQFLSNCTGGQGAANQGYAEPAQKSRPKRGLSDWTLACLTCSLYSNLWVFKHPQFHKLQSKIGMEYVCVYVLTFRYSSR